MTEERLRVALVGPSLGASGGIGRVMGYALEALDDPSVEVAVLDSRGGSSSPWLSALPLLRTCVGLLRRKIGGAVDVAHVNVSSHGSAFRKGMVVRLCHALRIPVVLHLHASSFPEFFDALPAPVRPWVARTFRMADRVVVLGEVWRGYVRTTFEVNDRAVTVLPNATPTAPQAIGRRPDDALHILFLGRLGERKGVPELLDALGDRRLRTGHWRLTLAGDGDLDDYRARVAAAGLADRVTFTGWMEPSAVAGLLQTAHVLVLPSKAEGMPMSVLEAFAAGVPIVCTPVGSLSEVAVDGTNGLVVPAGDVSALAGALLRVLDDDELRQQLAGRARQSWVADFAIGPYVARLVDVWRDASRVRKGADLARLGARKGLAGGAPAPAPWPNPSSR